MDSSNASDANPPQENELEKGKDSIPNSSSDFNGEINPVDQTDFVSGYQLSRQFLSSQLISKQLRILVGMAARTCSHYTHHPNPLCDNCN